MEFTNHKIIKKFISGEEAGVILEWVNGIDYVQETTNRHISEVRKNLNGNSYMYDISNNDLTKNITSYQSSNNVIKTDLPKEIHSIVDKITKAVGIPNENVFLQVLDMDRGGKINPHYDTGIDGYVTYKCNLSILSEDYNLVVDKETFNVGQHDLYCFEASLYRHWTEKEFDNRRVLLSFGFMIPYSLLGRDENDFRVRLSKRILKYLQ